MAKKEDVRDWIGGVPELSKQIKDLNTSVNSMTTDILKAQKAFDSQSKSQSDVASKTSKVKKVTSELEKIQARSNKVTIETVRATEELRKKRKALTDQVKKDQGTFKKSTSLFKSMTKSILTAGAAMLSLRAAFSVIKNGFKTIVEFEKGMSSVKAITNATAKEFKLLQANALKLGGTTAKTAFEVAGLQKEFAKLGFSTSEILAATEATINLSIAAESDLAEAATVAASTIRGFGLSATESTRVTDVMAKSFTTTGLNLEKFKVSMANAQVAAKSTGRTLEFTAAALGTIVDTGTDASKAGTDLRNIFAELARQGISLDEAYSMVNNSSNKVVTAMDLVGKRAFSSLITLAENTEKVDELTVAYENSAGAAKEMADIMADNLAGDITLATSAWDGFILSLNSGSGAISKSIRAVVSTFTDLLNVITKLNDGESLRLQRLKEVSGFEERINKIREKSIKIIKKKAEEENKSQATIALELATEAEARLANQKLQIKSLSVTKNDRDINAKKISQLELSRDLSIETINILNNIAATEQAAAEAATKAAEETARVKAQLIKEESKDRNEEVQKNIERLQKELEAKEALQLKAKEDSDALADSLVDDELQLADDELENLANQLDEEFKLQQEAAEKEIELEKEKQARKAEIRDAALDAAGQIVSDRLTAGIDENLAREQAAATAEQKILDDKLDKGLISEKEFAKQSAAIDLKSRQEAARADKKKALFDIAIDTIVAVAKTFATLGWPAGIAGAAVMAATGAAQAAVVAAKPIPKFKDGTKGKTSKDMMAIVGDGGESELVTTPQGNFLSPATDTPVFLPRGSEVFSGADTKEIAKEHSSSIIGMGELIKKQDKIIKAISDKPNYNTTITDKGMKVVVKSANNSKEYIDKYLRHTV